MNLISDDSFPIIGIVTKLHPLSNPYIIFVSYFKIKLYILYCFDYYSIIFIFNIRCS